MNSHTLTLLWTPWTLTLAVAFVLTTAAVCFFSWRRAHYSRWFGFLELLRFCIVILAALMLNQPEWVQQFRPDEKPTVAILYDNSVSMTTRDVQWANSQVVSRRESIEDLTAPRYLGFTAGKDEHCRRALRCRGDKR